MQDEFKKKRPLALLTYDELGYYFALNPQKLTAIDLLGADTAEHIGIFYEAVPRGNALTFPVRETYYQSKFRIRPDKNQDVEAYDSGLFRIGPDRIIWSYTGKPVHQLVCDETRSLFWETWEGKLRNPVLESVVFLCRPR